MPRERPRLSQAIGDRRPVVQPAHRVGGSPSNWSRSEGSTPSMEASRRVSSSTGCGVTVGVATATAPSATTRIRSAPSASGTNSRLERDGQPHGAGRHIGEQAVASLTGLQRVQGADGQHGAAEVAVGARGAADLLADDRDLGERGARPAELLGHLQPDPARVDERRPVDGPVLGEQIACHRTQFVVELRELVAAIRPRSVPAAAPGRARR